ncbi:MAG: hypothetical protein ACFE0I_18970 [Elainellaceae cyanobacterium]
MKHSILFSILFVLGSQVNFTASSNPALAQSEGSNIIHHSSFNIDYSTAQQSPVPSDIGIPRRRQGGGTR